MDFASYKLYFDSVLNGPERVAPYTDDDYYNYTKLNWSRQQRWLKTGELDENIAELIKGVQTPQKWILITEPWCGDAAHSVPFIYMLSALNPLIELDVQLRDAEPFLIDRYLTGTSKSIPKLIVRNEKDEDLLVWGPRPQKLQEMFDRMKAEQADFEEIKVQLQWWYNEDKGQSLQQELLAALKTI